MTPDGKKTAAEIRERKAVSGKLCPPVMRPSWLHRPGGSPGDSGSLRRDVPELLGYHEAVPGLIAAAVPAHLHVALDLIAFDVREGPHEVHLAPVDPLDRVDAAVVTEESAGSSIRRAS
jgi:hypothetical protein